MGSQWGRDRYHRRAKSEGYRSRAAYKLLDIQRRFQLIRPDDNVVDLGAAPGSWLQVLREITAGTVIGVDLTPIASVEDTLTITGDFTQQAVQDNICSRVREVGVVVCDAAPKLSGQKSYDQARSIGLAEDALGFCCTILKPGGNFVVKAFQGEQFDDFLAEVRERFRSVRVYRTQATRKGSTEAYVIAKNFRGTRDAA
ncbi:MAG: RlmE family RNA methyltransferase [Methanomicrobiaceae archaeon]|nr:RlmE family RNA methyltransferase [Methanomicrobiaceae archaeon]